jgi:hypothetical protein
LAPVILSNQIWQDALEKFATVPFSYRMFAIGAILSFFEEPIENGQ